MKCFQADVSLSDAHLEPSSTSKIELLRKQRPKASFYMPDWVLNTPLLLFHYFNVFWYLQQLLQSARKNTEIKRDKSLK